VADQAADALEPQVDIAGLTLSRQVHPVLVLGDETRFHQIIMGTTPYSRRVGEGCRRNRAHQGKADPFSLFPAVGFDFAHLVTGDLCDGVTWTARLGRRVYRPHQGLPEAVP